MHQMESPASSARITQLPRNPLTTATMTPLSAMGGVTRAWVQTLATALLVSQVLIYSPTEPARPSPAMHRAQHAAVPPLRTVCPAQTIPSSNLTANAS